MRILVLGDTHGRLIWNDVIKNESPDLVVFLGDYVSTHELISPDQQLSNLEDILNYKEENPEKVILLRGNHDIQHLGYYWAECSGFDFQIWKHMAQPEFKARFLRLTQWIYIHRFIFKNILFSHAGVSQVWMDGNDIKSVEDINKLEPSEIFGFTTDNVFDCCGDSVTQPPTWIRPTSLYRCNVKGYTQIVGHTPAKEIADIYKCTKNNEHIWLCDTLANGKYLLIEDGVFIPKSIEII